MKRLSTIVLCLLVGCEDDEPDASTDNECAEELAFIAAHQRCVQDSDCVIVGSCGGGFGFKAVERSAASQAQSYSDHTACGVAYDGPTYNAVCEQGSCSTLKTGHYCGQRIDAGNVCPLGQELVVTGCEDDAATPKCEERCAGEDDLRCLPAKRCVQVRASVAVPHPSAYCYSIVDAWLCR